MQLRLEQKPPATGAPVPLVEGGGLASCSGCSRRAHEAEQAADSSSPCPESPRAPCCSLARCARAARRQGRGASLRRRRSGPMSVAQPLLHRQPSGHSIARQVAQSAFARSSAPPARRGRQQQASPQPQNHPPRLDEVTPPAAGRQLARHRRDPSHHRHGASARIRLVRREPIESPRALRQASE